MVRLAQASHDERNSYSGGQPGNQTGSELNVRAWYNRPWDTVLRPYDRSLGNSIAFIAQKIVSCSKVGYDQNLSQRTSLYDQCALIGWNINKLDEIQPCECDCSSLIAVVLRFCGISISKSINTSSIEAALKKTGLFASLKESKYLTGSDHLLKGDIVLNTWHHVAVCIDNGPKAIVFSPYAALVTVKQTYLQVRTGPGSSYPEFGISNGDGTYISWRLPPNAEIAILEEKDGWGRVGDTSGWVSLNWVKKI